MTPEQDEELFNYLYNELDAVSLQSMMHDIEKIVKGEPFGYYFEGKFCLGKDWMNGKTFSENNKPIPLYK